ncbi:MAG: DUF5688 family protein [Lachnospiraceae bacterium]|nr:DUF5688 family protein [Lachnospiraceae bacterium]
MTDRIDFDRFTDEVQKAMEIRYPEHRVDLRRVTKNNGVIYTGISITGEDDNIYPTMYLEPFYEEYEGEVSEDVLDRMCRVYESRRMGEPLSLDYLGKYEEIRDGLRCKLINYEANTGMLEDVPYRRFMDLAIVPYYSFRNSGLDSLIKGEATFTVRETHLKMWGIDAERVLDDAVGNTMEAEKPSIRGITEVLRELNPSYASVIGSEADSCPMYIMSTPGINGAVSMMYEEELEEFCENLDSDIYVIPSSIHEVILVPANDVMPLPMLNDMIREINQTEVQDVEVLSDHAYIFSKNGGYRETV